MIVYHPVYDVNHCLYRILLALEVSEHSQFDWTLFKLMDLYVLFPHLLKEITPLPAVLGKFKRVIKDLSAPYEFLPNTKRILFELEFIQNSAVQNLMAKGLLDVSEFNKQKIVRTTLELPKLLHTQLISDFRASEEWYKLIVNDLPCCDLDGKNGLKARSKLMEYRYDA